MLKFSPANAKTKRLIGLGILPPKKKVYSLDLLAGCSCPGAKDCKCQVVISEDGKRTAKDGKDCVFRCFSASTEVLYPASYNLHKHNFDILRQMRGWKQCLGMLELSLPSDVGILRYAVSGDWFKAAYLKAAYQLALNHPDVLFYAYTKSIPFLRDIDLADPANGVVLDNFMMTASLGGKYDNLIPEIGLRTVKVVFDPSEAGDLPIDHDDSHAATPGGSFALLLHGTQPKGTEAAKAWHKIKTTVGGYK